MKRDMDLIRELLLRLEGLQIRSGGMKLIKPDSSEVAIEGFTADQIGYHMSQLRDAGFIDCVGTTLYDGSMAFRMLTWSGHEFTDAVRDPEIWARTKKGAEHVKGFTLDLLKDLAKGLLKKQLEEYTGVKL